MKLPTDCGDFELDDLMIKGFAAKYPQIDVNYELPKIYLWLHQNHSKRPKNMLRFVDNWLKKCKLKPAIRLAGGMTNQEIEEMGRAKNIPSRPGESYPQWLRRMRAA